MSAAAGDFDYLEFLKEEIHDEDASIKLQAVSRINWIASALGPQKTVSDLVPYLIQVIHEESLRNNEEFLFGMAKQYGSLSEFINGKDELVFPPLEFLVSAEETVIRDQAVKSICAVIEKRPSLCPEYVVPMVHRLVEKTDSFTAQVSVCRLFATTYKYAREDQKAGLRKAYAVLCSDDTPMVGRAAAHELSEFVSQCEKQDVLNDLMPIFKRFSQEDTQDTIRVACLNATLVIAQMLNAEENKQHTVTIVKDAIEDRSWRVRLAVAKQFDALWAAFGPEVAAAHLLQPFIGLLSDSEQEVRKGAVRVIEPLLALPQPLTNEQLETHLLPQFPMLGNDLGQPVRAALAHILGPVAKALGRDVTQRHLLTLISELMKDEFHDVRLGVVSHAGLICEVLGVDGLFHSLLHAMQSLIMDNHWRIRHSVVEQVPKLARLFGVEMFQTKLETLFLSSLRDAVHSVRQAAIEHVKEISEIFGGQWTVDHLLPKIIDQYSQSASYANRATTLHVLPRIAGVMTPDQTVQFIIPLLMKATKDAVANVRFCACQTIMEVMELHNLSQAINTVIKPTLQELEHDPDIDVQYYAQRALLQCPANN